MSPIAVPTRISARVAFGAVALASLAVVAGGASRRPPPSLPPIVFVSRAPDSSGQIPGVGPHGRALAPGGRLLLRARDGTVRELLPRGTLHDVADPAVSFDATRVVFSGSASSAGVWRIYEVGLDGSGFRAITSDGGDHDDLDPCWVTERLLCFASTRGGARAQYVDVPVTNLFLIGTDGSNLRRLTSERNSAEEPALDPATGHLIYSRWWFNRFRAADDEAGGLTSDPVHAMPGDSVNLWHAIEISADGSVFRLAAGEIPSRRGSTVYQPAVLASGTLVGVYAMNLGLSPRPGGLGVQAFLERYAEPLRLVGPIVPDHGVDAYGTPRGLAAPGACAPAALPDGRMLLAYDPGSRGDFGVFVTTIRGGSPERVIDLPGTLELDPAPVVRRPVPPGARAWERVSQAPASPSTFTYSSRNVFATGPVDSPVPGGPLLARGLRLLVYGVRPGATADEAELLRDVPIDAHGAVRVDGLPADRPLFEQLVDSRGRAVRTVHGPAHVAGLNFGRPGAVSRCAGCHLGHSILDSSLDSTAARRVNAAPSAAVWASSAAPGTRGADAAVDRRTRGNVAEVAWIATGAAGERLRLRWAFPIAISGVVLHGVRPERAERTDATIERARLVARRDGAEVVSRTIGRVRSSGTRVRFAPVLADELELVILESRGRVRGARAVALAELEVEARLAP